MYRPDQFLARDAAMFPTRLATVAQGRELTYRELDEISTIAARALRTTGVARGDRVAYLLGNNAAYVILFCALLKIGAVAVPLNKRLRADDIAYMLDVVEARALLFDNDMEQLVSDAIRACGYEGLLVSCGGGGRSSLFSALVWEDFKEIGMHAEVDGIDGYATRDDECLILFTSGTTGRPKAVVRTAEGVSMLAAVQVVEGHSLSRDVDVLYTQAPLYHMGGLCALLKMVAAGGTLVMESHFVPGRIFELIEHYDVDQLYMIPPALFSRLADSDDRAGRVFPGVRQAMCSGGRTRECDRSAVFDLFPNARVRQSFGSSEAGMTSTSYYTAEQFAAYPARAHSVGTVNAFVTIKIVDESGNQVVDGKTGQALVKSPATFSCYLKRPDATAEAFDEDGFFRTGDIMYRDASEEGFFVFVDRMSDVIKTGGENVFAVEVERVVQQHPAIADCAVIGVDDSRYGESVAAAVVLKEGARDTFDPQDLIAFFREREASFKKPRYLLVLDEIPRNNLGKVQKQQLRARAGEFAPIAGV